MSLKSLLTNNMINSLINLTMKTKREFIIKLNGKLIKAIEKLNKSSFLSRIMIVVEIIRLAKSYPDPNNYTTVFNNTKIIAGIRERQNKYHLNPSRRYLIDIALRMIQEKVETDGYYSFLHDWYIMELLKSGWKPERRGFPMYRYWNTGQLGTDFFTETNGTWLEKRRKELIELQQLDRAKVEKKIEDNTLWYYNTGIIEKVIKN